MVYAEALRKRMPASNVAKKIPSMNNSHCTEFAVGDLTEAYFCAVLMRPKSYYPHGCVQFARNVSSILLGGLCMYVCTASLVPRPHIYYCSCMENYFSLHSHLIRFFL